MTAVSTADGTRTIAYDATGTRAITYDARGNTLSEARPGGGTVSTSYDGHGRLLTYARTGELNQANAYNGLDERVMVTSSDGTTSNARGFVYDMDHRLVGEYGASAADPIAETIWLQPEVANDNQPFGGDDGIGGYAPLSVATGSGGSAALTWVHGNHMGVPIVTTDAAGAAVTPTGYTLPGFPGQTRTLADLYYNRYRDYDSATGRYIQADPIGLEGGSNPYLYAEGNPLRYIDPSGQNPLAVVAAICRINPQACVAVGAGIATGVCYITGACQQAGEAIRRGVENCPPDQAPTFQDDAKAPGKPGPKDGFKESKKGPKWGRAPNGKSGWVDDKGNVWVPTGPKGSPGAHGGPHWDVQGKRGGYNNVYPGGKTRP